jgi:hypothetical protein
VSGQLSRFLNYSIIHLLLEFCCSPGIQCSLGTLAVILSNVTTKGRSCDNCKLPTTVDALYVSLSLSLSLVKYVWNRIKRCETVGCGRYSLSLDIFRPGQYRAELTSCTSCLAFVKPIVLQVKRARQAMYVRIR